MFLRHSVESEVYEVYSRYINVHLLTYLPTYLLTYLLILYEGKLLGRGCRNEETVYSKDMVIVYTSK